MKKIIQFAFFLTLSLSLVQAQVARNTSELSTLSVIESENNKIPPSISTPSMAGGTLQLTVSSAADSGPGTLREAINTVFIGEIYIDFDPILDGVPILLSSSLDITSSVGLVIRGRGENLTIISANFNNFYALNVGHISYLALTDLTIRDASDGIFTSGGIYGDSGSNIQLSRVTIDNCSTSSGFAAGIDFNGNQLLVYNSKIINNTYLEPDNIEERQASNSLLHEQVGSSEKGVNVRHAGGVAVRTGIVAIVNSVIADNSFESTPTFGGGGITVSALADLTLINCTIHNNTSLGFDSPGGLFVTIGSGLNLSNSVLVGNQGQFYQDIRIFVNPTDSEIRTTLFSDGPAGVNLAANGILIATESLGPNYNLLANSVAIDAGLSTELTEDIFDYDEDLDSSEPIPIDVNNLQRIRGREIDMGATEFQSVEVQGAVILEGGTNSGTFGYIMNASLASSGNIELNQPYSALPWSYSGTESVLWPSSDIVDWVLLELRDPANIDNVLASRAAFLGTDGILKDVDNQAGVIFKNANVSPNNSYYLVIRHRNHLDICSANPIEFPNPNFLINNGDPADFSYGYNVLGGDEQVVEFSGGYNAMHAGDFNGNGTITVADFNLYSSDQNSGATIGVYKLGDCNFDANITVSDFNFYLPNSSKIGSPVIRY